MTRDFFVKTEEKTIKKITTKEKCGCNVVLLMNYLHFIINKIFIHLGFSTLQLKLN